MGYDPQPGGLQEAFGKSRSLLQKVLYQESLAALQAATHKLS